MRRIHGGPPSLKTHLEGAVRLPMWGDELDSFYHLAGQSVQHKFCAGLSCFAAQARNPERWANALEQKPRIYCLGRCYASPSSSDDRTEPAIETLVKDPIVLDGVAGKPATSFDHYRAIGGYEGLRLACDLDPACIVEEVEKSQLRGRGGAGFPAGKKWRSVFNVTNPIKYVVANADEGDHGAYIDRFIMERAPHRLLEAMAIAARAISAKHGYIYLRKEYPACLSALETAITEAKSAGILDGFTVEVIVGQGSYVCGEETSLLNSIEHRRPEVRARPPYPTEFGLFGKPTLVSNVETFASIPWIIRNGGDAYAARGFSSSRGTKAISLNSLFNRPGLYEIEFGMPLQEIFEEIGGGLKDGPIKAAVVGGPIAGMIHPKNFGTPLGFEEMHAIGAAVGHGGIVAFGESTRMIDVLAHIFVFGSTESCGKCTPCRLGSSRALNIFQDMASGGKLGAAGREELFDILHTMKSSSLCGHGTGLAEVALSILENFSDEVAECFA